MEHGSRGNPPLEVTNTIDTIDNLLHCQDIINKQAGLICTFIPIEIEVNNNTSYHDGNGHNSISSARNKQHTSNNMHNRHNSIGICDKEQ